MAIDLVKKGDLVEKGDLVKKGTDDSRPASYRRTSSQYNGHMTSDSRSLLTLAPMRVEGGTGSPVNPIATF